MASDDLRARVAEALCPPHHRIGSISFGQPVTPLSPCLLHQAQADTVAELVQPELDRLNAELHRHADCAQCGHERHRHGYEPIIRRDWCSDCPTASDLHTFQAKESPS